MRDFLLRAPLSRKLFALFFYFLFINSAYSETKLLASNGQMHDRLGNSIAINGDKILIGSYYSNDFEGSVYYYKKNNHHFWSQAQQIIPSEGTSFSSRRLDLAGDVFVSSTSENNAFVYKYNGWEWVEEKILYVPGNITVAATNGEKVLLGNPVSDIIDNAFVYKRQDNQWMIEKTLNGNNPENWSDFASALTISDQYAVIAERGDSILHIFEKKFGAWDWGNPELLFMPDFYSSSVNYVTQKGNLILVSKNDDKGEVYIVEKQNGNWLYSGSVINEENTFPSSEFGYGAAIVNDDFIVISEPNLYKDFIGEPQPPGSVHFYKRENYLNWKKIKTIQANDGHIADQYGSAIDVSLQCELAVGAVFNNQNGDYSGAGYYYDIVNVLGAKEVHADTKSQDWLGFSTAIDVNGGNTFLIAGAPLNDENGENRGAAYIYNVLANNKLSEIVTLSSDNGPSIGDLFGISVDIDGDYAIVGARGDDDNGTNAGAAYVFKRSASEKWNLEAKLKAEDGYWNDLFANSVAIDINSNGEVRAIIGAHEDDDNGIASGSAYIFKRENNGSWVQEKKLTAFDGHNADWFGWSVDISSNRVIVGAYQDDDQGDASGAAYIFVQNNGIWLLEKKIIAPDIGEVDYFGYSVAIDKDYAAIGASRQDGVLNEKNNGAVYVYRKEGTWLLDAKLTAPDGHADDLFGQAIDLDRQITGSIQVIVGAANKEKDVTVNDIPDINIENAGAAYLFASHEPGSWELARKHEAENPSHSDLYGLSVAVKGNYVATGAPLDNKKGTDSGVFYVYDQNICQY